MHIENILFSIHLSAAVFASFMRLDGFGWVGLYVYVWSICIIVVILFFAYLYKEKMVKRKAKEKVKKNTIRTHQMALVWQ